MSYLRLLRKRRLISRPNLRLPQILPNQNQTPNLKEQLPKEKKNLLSVCKHWADQEYKHANKKCVKCHKKGHISCFYDIYNFRNKKKTQ